MNRQHHYKTVVTWTGNKGEGTVRYTGYDRDHVISIPGKPDLLGTSDPAFRGDPSRHSPEDLLVAALSGCHMLWYLHLCTTHGVVVTAYRDEASGIMDENSDGSGQFREVVLRPVVTVQHESMIEKAQALHKEANKMCFIARSVKFPVLHEPTANVSAEKSIT